MGDQIDISPEAVEALAAAADSDTIRWPAVRDTLRALSARVAEVEKERNEHNNALIYERQEYARLKARLTEALDLDGVEKGDGFWKSCTGCHETNEGCETGHYPYSKALKCYRGAGCSECGGLGAVWDNTDYEHMVRALIDQTPAEVTVQDARIPDHSAWAARGRWREAYEALRARLADLEAAIDSSENDGNMWRFWSDKARKLATKNSALEAALATARRDEPYLVFISRDQGVCIGGRWHGWLFYRHPDGQWVSQRKLTAAPLSSGLVGDAKPEPVEHNQHRARGGYTGGV